MKKLIATILISTFALSAFAKDSILTCTLKNPETKETKTKVVNLNKLSDEYERNSGRISAGETSYSFNLDVTQDGKKFELSGTFDGELDEVGDFSCVYTKAKGTKVFCQDSIKEDGETVANFYCQVKPAK